MSSAFSWALLVMVVAALGVTAQTPALEQRWHQEIQPILEEYCYDCHGEGVKKGELELDRFQRVADMQAERGLWQRIRSHIDQELMPPPDELAPKRQEREAIVRWIDEAVFPVDPNRPDPGRVTLRRLNRIEYENTVHDLLGISTPLRDLLPEDDSGYGFDNNGDALTLSPLHLERLLESARVALDAAIRLGPMPFPKIVIEGKDLKGAGHSQDGMRILQENGRVRGQWQITKAGTYRIDLHAGGTMGGGAHPEVELRHGDQRLASFVIQAPMDAPEMVSHDLVIEAPGACEISLVFTNDFYQPDHPDANQRDRNLAIARIALTGPLNHPRPPKPESHRNIFGDRERFDHDIDWAADIFRRFGSRAFRRPMEQAEVERYLQFVRMARDSGVDVEEGIRLGLEAMLVSPSFLYREEPQPEPDNADKTHLIDEFTLANRLSYFLWSTMPDERLMRLASEGNLRRQLDTEIDRMIQAPSFQHWIEGFAGQWLQLRDLEHLRLSSKVYPNASSGLSRDLMHETQHFVRYLVRENQPITDLLEADYTFLNERLARHYGIPGIQGNEFRKTSLIGTPRRGLLGQGSFHMVTSFPLRTSPVLRGKYVLENLLDRAPPPPPPNVPALAPTGQAATSASLREELEKHRADVNCASCHALMDPIGFGLDCFDADGSYRTESGGQPIDLAGELIGGRTFTGPDELRGMLLRDHKQDVLRGVASKMLTYALGRGTEWYDKPALDRIVRACEADGCRSHAMIRALIRSVPFQYRRGNG